MLQYYIILCWQFKDIRLQIIEWWGN